MNEPGPARESTLPSGGAAATTRRLLLVVGENHLGT